MTRLSPTESDPGRGKAIRGAFLIMVSVAVWMLELYLIAALRFSPPPYELSMLFYSLLVLHLLPWAVGLQALGRIKKASSKGMMETSGAQLAHDIVLSLLVATYVVLGSAETIGIQSFRISAFHSPGSLGQ